MIAFFFKNKAPSLTRLTLYVLALLLSSPMMGLAQSSEYHGPPALSSLVFAMEVDGKFEQCRAFHIRPGVAMVSAYCATKYNFKGIVFDNNYTIWPKLIHREYWALSAIESAQSYPVRSVRRHDAIGVALLFYDFPENKVLTSHPTIPLLPPHITTPFHKNTKVYITSLNIGRIFNIPPPPYNQMLYAVPGLLLHRNNPIAILKDSIVYKESIHSKLTIGHLEDSVELETDGIHIRKFQFFYPDNPGFKIYRKVNRLYGCAAYDTSGAVYWQDPGSGQWYVIGILGAHYGRYEFPLDKTVTDEYVKERTACFALGVVYPFDHFAHYWITSTIDTELGIS